MFTTIENQQKKAIYDETSSIVINDINRPSD